MKPAYIHIGAPKTATTSLQKSISLSRTELEKLGISLCPFLGNENNRKLVYALMEREEPNKIQQSLDLAIPSKRVESLSAFALKLSEMSRQREVKTVVITSEDFQSQLNQDEILRLKSILIDCGLDPKIILYIREQASAINSHFSTALKFGKAVRLTPSTPSSDDDFEGRYNYYAKFMAWAHAFGAENIFLRIFESSCLVMGSIYEDFSSLVGIPPGLLQQAISLARSSNTINSSLTADCVKYLYILGKIHKGRLSDSQYNAAHGWIRSTYTSGRVYKMPLRMWRDIREVFADSNEMLRRELFKDRGELFDISDPTDCCEWALQPSKVLEEQENLILPNMILNCT
jgi:hypothetical protein